MNAGATDYEARTKANSAMQAIQAHETHCGERWSEARRAAEDLRSEVRKGFDGFSESTRRLHQRIDKIIWAVTAALVGIMIQALLIWWAGAQ
jgi:hypothetical protein